MTNVEYTSDDLISRAAAIDAIVSATVFPDSDYIKNLCQNPANSEDWLGGVCDAINAVEDVNAVDAIPVEWLEAHKTEYYEDWGEEPITVENALKMWQREQEAKKLDIEPKEG